MKTKFIVALACLLMISVTTLSCSGCEDNNNDPLPAGTPEVAGSESVDTTSETADSESFGATEAASAGDRTNNENSTGAGKISDNEGRTAGSPSTMSTSANKARDLDGKKKPAKNLEGYSAPNGTAAENYDGDPYTKHDTTPMPSGTPIR